MIKRRNLVGVLALLLLGVAPISCSFEPEEVALTAKIDLALQTEAEQRWDNVVSRFPLAKKPDTHLVRYVQPDEWGQAQKECLQNQGFAVTVRADGGIETSIPPEQGEPYAIAEFECALMYPLDRKYTDPLNEKMLIHLYEYQTGPLTECLNAEGHDVIAPPSMETFIQNYYTDNAWTPYDIDVFLSEELLAACPMVPESLWEQR